MDAKRSNRRVGNFESMEERKLFAADLGFDLAAPAPDPQPAEQALVDSEGGELTMDRYEQSSDGSGGKEWHDTKPMGWDNTVHKKWTDSGIRVDREMTESGEKGGTEDIKVGVGELQECTISKSMDSASMNLAQFAINGNSPGTAEIDFVEVAGGGDAAPGHNIGLMSTSGDIEVGQVSSSSSDGFTAMPEGQTDPVGEDFFVRAVDSVLAQHGKLNEAQSIASTDVIFETDNDVELFLLKHDNRVEESPNGSEADDIMLNKVHNADGPIRVMPGGTNTGIFLRTDVESL